MPALVVASISLVLLVTAPTMNAYCNYLVFVVNNTCSMLWSIRIRRCPYSLTAGAIFSGPRTGNYPFAERNWHSGLFVTIWNWAPPFQVRPLQQCNGRLYRPVTAPIANPCISVAFDCLPLGGLLPLILS